MFPGKTVAVTKPVGESGAPIVGGYLVSGEKDSRLQGRNRYITYADTIANVDIVTAGLRYFGDLIGKVSWKWQAADDTARAAELAEWIEEVVNDMETPWHRVMRRAAMYKAFGFAIAAWTAKRRPDGSIGFADIEPRPQSTIERWDVTPTGELLGVTQLSQLHGREMYIPRDRMLYMVDDALDSSPEGFGLLRGVVKHATVLQAYELLEAFSFESDLRGMPLIRAPLAALNTALRSAETGEVDPVQIEAMLRPLREFLQKHRRSPQLGVMLDSSVYRSTDDGATPSGSKQYDLEILKGDASGQQEIGAAIERKIRGIARILGVEFLLLGSDSKGSHALSESKTESFSLLVDSTLVELASATAKDVVGSLWELNGFEDELRPTPTPDRVQFRTIGEITAAIKDMAIAGVPLDPEDDAVNELRGLLGLSRAKVDRMLEEREMALAQTAAAAADAAADGEEPDPGEPEDEPEPEPEPAANGDTRRRGGKR